MFSGRIKLNTGLKWVIETNGRKDCHYYKISAKLFQNQTKVLFTNTKRDKS